MVVFLSPYEFAPSGIYFKEKVSDFSVNFLKND